MAEVYSSVQDVLDTTGVTYHDLSFSEDLLEEEKQEKLEDIIEKFLLEIKSFIDADRNRDYLQEVSDGDRDIVPEGINSVARRACQNMINVAIHRRETSVMTYEDFTNLIPIDKAFTSELLNDLRRFPAKPKFRIFFLETKSEVEDALAEEE